MLLNQVFLSLNLLFTLHFVKNEVVCIFESRKLYNEWEELVCNYSIIKVWCIEFSYLYTDQNPNHN